MSNGLTGPGIDLRKYTEQCEADGPPNYESISPCLLPANRFLKQRDDLAELCGEILATLRVPGNQEIVIGDPRFQEVLLKWRERYEKCSGNPN